MQNTRGTYRNQLAVIHHVVWGGSQGEGKNKGEVREARGGEGVLILKVLHTSRDRRREENFEA